MELYPAAIVFGLADATARLAQAKAAGVGVTLVSAPGAALHAGCGWWRSVVAAARARHPDVPCIDILDCADATGQALAALRIGVIRLVLWPEAPGREAVGAIAESLGGFLLPAAPPVDPSVNSARAKRGSGSGFPARSDPADRGSGEPDTRKR
jgi:hypothetical protein